MGNKVWRYKGGIGGNAYRVYKLIEFGTFRKGLEDVGLPENTAIPVIIREKHGSQRKICLASRSKAVSTLLPQTQNITRSE